jgi:hypothetical protein
MFDDGLSHQSVSARGSWDGWATALALRLTAHTYWEIELDFLERGSTYGFKFWLDGNSYFNPNIQPSSLHPKRFFGYHLNNCITIVGMHFFLSFFLSFVLFYVICYFRKYREASYT